MAETRIPEPSVTAIVPTRNRPAVLVRCLDALADQRFPGEVEIVVVDDGSDSAEAVAELVEGRRGARLVRLSGNGTSAARNAGVDAARSEFVCFTDDDCVPDPGWIAALTARLNEGADVVGGLTVNGNQNSPLAAASQLVSNAVFESTAERAAPASNLSCHRTVALTVRFDETYAGIAAEERDWYARVIEAGYDVALEPKALVRHLPTVSLSEFVRKHVRYGRGAYRFRRSHRSGRLERPGFYARLIGAGFREGLSTGLAVCLAQVATAVGFALEMSTKSPQRSSPTP